MIKLNPDDQLALDFFNKELTDWYRHGLTGLIPQDAPEDWEPRKVGEYNTILAMKLTIEARANGQLKPQEIQSPAEQDWDEILNTLSKRKNGK